MSILVRMRNLKKYYLAGKGLFSRSRKEVHAVDGVSLDIEQGKTLGLVGESGCGKTTLGMLCLRLLDPTEGTVEFNNGDIYKFGNDQLKSFRSEAQIIFQDPYGSLNPRKPLSQILSIPYIVHKTIERDKIGHRIRELLEMVGLTPADLYVNRYPHDLSGGQRQRVAIARAIATNPKFIVADEPVASLDVSVRAQILNLMKKLQKETGVTYLYITHDLAVMRSVSHKVAIMYLGQVVELAEVSDICEKPFHPYTKALLSAVPLPDPRETRLKNRIVLKGELPSAIDIPKGCRFYGRCFARSAECDKEEPGLREVAKDHLVRCMQF